MKYEVSFEKVQTETNDTQVEAKITVLSSDVGIQVFSTHGQVNIYPRVGAHGTGWSHTSKTFDTPAEAESWVKSIEQQMKKQYAAYAAAFESVDLPENRTMEIHPFAT